MNVAFSLMFVGGIPTTELSLDSTIGFASLVVAILFSTISVLIAGPGARRPGVGARKVGPDGFVSSNRLLWLKTNSRASRLA